MTWLNYPIRSVVWGNLLRIIASNMQFNEAAGSSHAEVTKVAWLI